MRDLIRSRGAAMAQRLVTHQQLQAFLLRHGRIFPGIKKWGPVYYRWLGGQKFELPAHQAILQDYANAVLDADRLSFDKSLESTTPTDEAVPPTCGQGEARAGRGNGSRSRIARLHVGHWPSRHASKRLRS